MSILSWQSVKQNCYLKKNHSSGTYLQGFVRVKLLVEVLYFNIVTKIKLKLLVYCFIIMQNSNLHILNAHSKPQVPH